MMASALRKAFDEYRDLGLVVIPAAGKRPIAIHLENGQPQKGWRPFLERRPDDREIALWDWEEASGLGVVIGPATWSSWPFLWALDVEAPHREEAEAWLDRHLPDWRDGVVVETGRGGLHIYFLASRPVATRPIPWGEVRGGGSLCVLPPSRHPETGRLYRFLSRRWTNIPPAEPEQIPGYGNSASAPSALPKEPLNVAEVLQGVEKGRRNITLFRLACKLRATGIPKDIAIRILSEAAARCTPPWGSERDEEPVEKMVERVYRRYPGPEEEETRTGREAPAPPAPSAPEEVEPEKIYRHLLHLREIFAGQLRWCPEWRTWLMWNATHWQRVPTEMVVARAIEALKDFYIQKLSGAQGREAEKWARRLVDLFSTSHVEDAVDLLRGYDGFLTPAARFDADPYIINLRNGILDLRAMELRPHDPNALCTRIANARYDPNAEAPRWRRFLEEIFDGDQELIGFLQRACGLALIGENRHHLFYILYGTGANGKSTFLKTLRYVFGDYGGPIPRDAIVARRHQQDAQRTAYAALEGLRFATLEELSDEIALSIVAVKDLTSNNPMRIRRLYENYREASLGLTPFLAVNTKPVISEYTEGTWRRIRLIPFNKTIPPEQQDPELPGKLMAEADGIMRWLIDGLREYWRRGLDEPPSVIEATKQYRSEQDVLEEFLNECCELQPGALTPATELYAAYRSWALSHGEREETLLSERAFGRRLSKRGIEAIKGPGGVRLRRGIRLRTRPDSACGVSGVSGGLSEKFAMAKIHGELFINNATDATNATASSENTTLLPEQGPAPEDAPGKTGESADFAGVGEIKLLENVQKAQNLPAQTEKQGKSDEQEGFGSSSHSAHSAPQPGPDPDRLAAVATLIATGGRWAARLFRGAEGRSAEQIAEALARRDPGAEWWADVPQALDRFWDWAKQLQTWSRTAPARWRWIREALRLSAEAQDEEVAAVAALRWLLQPERRPAVERLFQLKEV